MCLSHARSLGFVKDTNTPLQQLTLGQPLKNELKINCAAFFMLGNLFYRDYIIIYILNFSFDILMTRHAVMEMTQGYYSTRPLLRAYCIYRHRVNVPTSSFWRTGYWPELLSHILFNIVHYNNRTFLKNRFPFMRKGCAKLDLLYDFKVNGICLACCAFG